MNAISQSYVCRHGVGSENPSKERWRAGPISRIQGGVAWPSPRTGGNQTMVAFVPPAWRRRRMPPSSRAKPASRSPSLPAGGPDCKDGLPVCPKSFVRKSFSGYPGSTAAQPGFSESHRVQLWFNRAMHVTPPTTTPCDAGSESMCTTSASAANPTG